MRRRGGARAGATGALAALAVLSAAGVGLAGSGAGAAAPTWVVVPSANPPGPPQASLAAVSCPAAGQCVAVGQDENPSALTVPLAEVSANGTWSEAAAPPPPAGAVTSGLNGVWCGSATSCMAVGSSTGSSGAVAPLAESWDGSHWTATTVPATGGGSLVAVACSGATCAAVGTQGSGAGATPLAALWDGAAWTQVPVPLPAAATTGSLAAVSCPASGDCVAVGSFTTGTGTFHLIESLAAGAWAVQPAPSPVDADTDTLASVSCPTADSCMATGSFALAGSRTSPMALSWDGSAWHLLAVPLKADRDGEKLDLVSCATATACTGLAAVVAGLHDVSDYEWDGSTWTRFRSGPGSVAGGISGLSCPAADQCTAVGYRGEDNYITQAASGGGPTWTRVTTPDPPGPGAGTLSAVSCDAAASCVALGTIARQKVFGEVWGGTGWTLHSPKGALSAVSCVSPTWCTAVGPSSTADDARANPEVGVWDGASWHPEAGGALSSFTSTILDGVSCTATDFCMAVGSYNGDAGTLAEEWDGTSWRVVTSPSPASGPDSTTLLDAVSCASSTACVAVGWTTPVDRTTTVIAEVWDGTRWRLHSPPQPASTDGARLAAVSCAAGTTCMAVGESEASATGQAVPLSAMWDGSRWHLVTVPVAAGEGGSVLNGVSCPSTTSCTAVGSTGDDTSQGFAEQWDGTAWTPQATATLPTSNELDAVSCPSPGACTAVGGDGTTVVESN